MIDWQPRSEPLAPTAVAGVGPAARELGMALARRDDEVLAQLRAVASADVLVVLGPEASLPWADGVVFLGIDPVAPSLLLPTVRAPAVPLHVFEQAVLRKAAKGGVVAVVDAAGLLVPVSAARPIDRGMLMQWLKRDAS